MPGANIQVNGKKFHLKVFASRESLITELSKGTHFATIKHVFFSVLVGLLVRDLVCVLTNCRNANFGFTIIKDAFRSFHHAVFFWSILFTINVSTYFAFRYWAEYRKNLFPKSRVMKLLDYFCLVTLIITYVALLTAVPLILLNYVNLGMASTVAVLMENVRFLMKTHAFIRHNAPDVLNFKPHTDESVLPSLTNFLYFSFAPTLVYRREYPRTEAINVRSAIVYFGEVLLIIWLQSYICEMFFFKPFSHFGKADFTWSKICIRITEGALGGGVIMVIDFYLLLHAWQNGFADLLGFADRKFYEDWWTSTNYSTYFRTWNIIVHDWLYEYVYREFYLYITPNKKSLAKIVVFLLSAVIHEYIIVFSFNQFLPVVFINFFLFGLAFTFLQTKHPLCNAFLLYSLALGNSINFSIHTMGYYAKTNCHQDRENVSYFIPRFIWMDCTT